MKNKLVYLKLFSAALMLFGVSCTTGETYSDLDEEGQDLYSQQAMIFKADGTNSKQALFSDVSGAMLDTDSAAVASFQFNAVLVKKNARRVSLAIASTPNQVDVYNQVYGTSYLQLPEELASYTKTLSIDSAKVLSDNGTLTVKYSSKLKVGQKYLLALTASSQSDGIGVMETTKTMFYSIQLESNKVTTSALLTRETYFKINKNNSKISDLGTTFTLEGLICVSKFRTASDVGDAQISTFMGTEGGTLVRFGDAGLDGNRLQANGTAVGSAFSLNKWYHVALVVNNGTSSVYINGEPAGTFAKAGSIGEFYIGRSYNDNRGIDAKVAEIRIWKTARTAEQIKQCMYKVKDLTGIYAYWRMNSITDGLIRDDSGNDNNLVLWGQPSNVQKVITLVDEGADGVQVGK
ncbi:MAG: DUF1735 and LamG domain-containing protein [Dysgonamonadaceae bacterium]